MSFAGGQARDPEKPEICLAEKLGRRGEARLRAEQTAPVRVGVSLPQLPKAEIRFSCPAGLLTDPFPRAPSRKRIVRDGLLPSVRRESQQRVLVAESHGVPSFGREASRRPKQCKGRHKSGPAPVRSVQSIDFLSTITGFVFQSFDKRMIAYGFVPVGGPGPDITCLGGCGGVPPVSAERDAAFPCLAGAGRASDSPLARRRSLPRTNRPSRHVRARDFRSPAEFPATG